MKVFGRQFEDGPGIYREPEKKGVDLLIFIIRERFFQLVSVNLMFVLSLLTIVTIGPAVMAISKTTMDLARRKPMRATEIYKEEFRKDFGKRVFLGLASFVVVLILGFGIFFYVRLGAVGVHNYVIAAITFLVLLYVMGFLTYFIRLEAYMEFSFRERVRNAFLLLTMTSGKLLLMFILVLLPLYFLITRWEVGVPFLVLWQFVLGSQICSIISKEIFDEYLVK